MEMSSDTPEGQWLCYFSFPREKGPLHCERVFKTKRMWSCMTVVLNTLMQDMIHAWQTIEGRRENKTYWSRGCNRWKPLNWNWRPHLRQGLPQDHIWRWSSMHCDWISTRSVQSDERLSFLLLPRKNKQSLCSNVHEGLLRHAMVLWLTWEN